MWQRNLGIVQAVNITLSPMPFEIQNPVDLKEWDNDLRALDDSGLFHTSAWAAVLAKAYHYRPAYITHYKGDRLSALLPVMEINSLLTGRRGVSLPFTDNCPAVAESNEHLRKLIEFSTGYALKQKWRYLELRMDTALPFKAAPRRLYKRHILKLDGSADAIQGKFRKSTVRNVKRALRSGIRVDVSNDRKSVREFYRLNCLTRKRHGLPPQPWYFFEALFEEIIKPHKGDVFLATLNNNPIAGSIFLKSRHTAIYKYGASDMKYARHRANNIVMWEAIQKFHRTGYQTIDFGRTEFDNEGLCQFKRGWGTEENTLYYYVFDTKSKTFLPEISSSAPGYDMFRILPVWLLRVIGHFLYPHVG
jgi:hypothetical protein